MAKILVLYYSMYGHIETMAHAVADGANRVDGVSHGFNVAIHGIIKHQNFSHFHHSSVAL